MIDTLLLTQRDVLAIAQMLFASKTSAGRAVGPDRQSAMSYWFAEAAEQMKHTDTLIVMLGERKDV